MKKIAALALGVGFALSSLEANWDDFLKSVQDNQKLDESGHEVVGKLYNATIKYSIEGGNGDNKLANDEKVNLRVIGSDGKVLETQKGMTIKELRVWSKENANELLKAIFNGEPSSTISGQPTATTTTESIYRQTKLLHTINSTFISKVMLDSESTSSSDGIKNIDSTGGILNYSQNLERGDTLGVLVAYRYSTTDDIYNSEMGNIAISPFYKINTQINDKFSLGTIFNLTTNMVYLKSSIFPDGGGYIEYGTGVGVVPKYQINDNFFIDASLGYQYMKKYIPSSSVPDDLKFITDAINDLKALQTLSYGIGASYNILKEWKVNGDILQIKHLVTDDLEKGRDKATYYTLSSIYDWNSWTFGLGYKIVKDVANYDEDSYMFTVRYHW